MVPSPLPSASRLLTYSMPSCSNAEKWARGGGDHQDHLRPEAAVQARLAASPVSQTINTSFVERNNLTCRQCNGRLSRKVLSFSKVTWLEKHLWLSLAYYHFVCAGRLEPAVVGTQPTRGSGSPKQWQPVTPAMAAGLTDHVWTMEELLSYRVPPDFRDRLDPQVVNNPL